MKEFITDTLIQFRKGEITLEQAADRLRAQQLRAQTRKAKSNRRLKSMCGALQGERDPAKIRELKAGLRHEFYDGDQGS